MSAPPAEGAAGRLARRPPAGPRRDRAGLRRPGDLGADPAGRFLSGRDASPDAVRALVCALAGYFTQRSLEPPPPGLPTLRAFQAGPGEAARRWLAGLL